MLPPASPRGPLADPQHQCRHYARDVRRAVSTLTLLCCVLACAPALAAGPLPTARLVTRGSEMPGFAGARTSLNAYFSAFTWGHRGSGTWTESEEEASSLRALGFEQGVEELFLGRRRESHGRHPEAASEALVFATAASAQSELRAFVADGLAKYARNGLREFPGPAIPGSLELDAVQGGRRGSVGNVFFSTGRCLFVVGNFVYDAKSRAQVVRAPVAGALALYRRNRRLCG